MVSYWNYVSLYAKRITCDFLTACCTREPPRLRVIPHQINREKRHFQPEPLRIEWVFVRLAISIPAKFYCFMTTRFLTADIQICQKTSLFGTSCLRKSGITSTRIEEQILFYAHFKANEMPFPMTYYTNTFSTVMYPMSSNLTFDPVFLKMLYFNFLIYCVHVTII
jgi:hypothetical protein